MRVESGQVYDCSSAGWSCIVLRRNDDDEYSWSCMFVRHDGISTRVVQNVHDSLLMQNRYVCRLA